MKKETRVNSFNTGVAAEYFVLSQLYRIGVEAYVSQGNKKAIDIRIIRKDGTPISLDVKAVRGYSSLIVNNVVKQKNHYIAFVIYNDKFEDIKTMPEVFILPSSEVIKIAKHFKEQKRVMKGDIIKYKDKWENLVK